MKKLAAVIALLLSLPIQARNQRIFVHNGFGTGQTYVDMSNAEKKAYVMGVMNGILLAPLFGAPKRETAWIENCSEDMTDVQVAAILTKYLENNPGRWHEQLHQMIYSAMKDACPKGQSAK